jgi:hypothetical protein
VDYPTELGQVLRVLPVSLAFWMLGFFGHKAQTSGLVKGPQWLSWLCGLPRKDGRLSPYSVGLQAWAYSIPLLVLCVRACLPMESRGRVYVFLSLSTMVVVTLLVRFLLERSDVWRA